MDGKLAVLAVLSILAGCAHERVVWPPTPAAMAPIYAAAYDEQYLRVDFVDPVAARRELGDLGALKLKTIVWVDDEQIIFRSQKDGELLPVPAEKLRGLTVKDRERGGLIGALIGAGASAAAMLGAWYLFVDVGDWNAFPAGCTASCEAKFIAGWVGAGTLAGIVIGYMISGKRSYDFVPAR